MGDNIIAILVCMLFIIFLGYGLINNLIKLFKSRNYKTINAKVINSVVYMSEDWGKYFPLEYEDQKNQEEKINELADKVDKASKLIDKIPIKINKNGISINLGNKSNNDKSTDISNNTPTYSLIAEYEVSGKKYYFYDIFANHAYGDPFKKKIGKNIKIKYDPKEPNKNIKINSKASNILLILFIEILFIIMTMYIVKNM